MKVEVLGTGCARCKRLAKNVEAAIKDLGIEAELVKVDDITEIMDRGVMLTPALAVALFGKSSVWTPMRTIGFNISGHPALALPMGFSDGLPLGMQLVGPRFGEARLCQIGDAFERATDHAAQRPPHPPR